MRNTVGLQAVVLACGVFVTAAIPQEGPPPAAPVEVETVAQVTFTPTAFVLGTTEPKRRSVVAASIEGSVMEFPVDEGMRVKKGAILARLRDTVLRLQLQEAESSLKETRAQHENAKRDLERAQQLVATDAVTEKDFDARATLERTLGLRIAQSAAKVEILKEEIDKKKVTAPFDGQIVEEHTQVGEWLLKGGPVATLVDISSLYVRVNVAERYVRFVAQDEPVTVWATAASDEPFTGKVFSIPDEGDPTSRTFPVRIEVEREGQLRAGMSARVEIPAGKPQTALVVSKDAILLRGTQSFVFVVGEGNRAERRAVKTGASSGSKFAVLEGLQAGEKVVVKGNERIQPGIPLRIVGKVR